MFPRSRPLTTMSRPVTLAAIGAIALGVMLARAAGAFEEPDSSKPVAVRPSRAVSAAELRLKADVSFLADDAREGREPGTKGIEASADYIAGVFKAAGLKPAPGADGYFQPFTIGGDPTLGTIRNWRSTGRMGGRSPPCSRPTSPRWPSASVRRSKRCPSSSPATGSRPTMRRTSWITTITRASTSRGRPS